MVQHPWEVLDPYSPDVDYPGVSDDASEPIPDISFIGAGAAVGAENPPSLTPDKDVAGLAVGDFMIAHAVSRSATGSADAATHAWSAGWTELTESVIPTGTPRDSLAWRVYEAGDGDPTVTFTGGSSPETMVAQVAVFRSVDPISPIDVLGAWFVNGSAVNIGPIPGITPLTEGAVIVVVGSKKRIWTSVDVLSGDGLTWAEIGEHSEAAGADASIVWDYAEGWVAGAVTDKTFILNGSAAVGTAGVMFSLKPGLPA